MQTLRSTLIRVPRLLKLNRITKPTATATTRPFSTTPTTANMSLFPRFTQEFAPIFRLFDEYDRQAFRNIDRDLQSVRSFTPKFDVKETKDAYELHGELPGIEQKDINIEWTDNNTITISGRHELVREEGQRPQGFIENGNSGEQKKLEQYQPKVEDDPAESEASKNNKVATQSNQKSDVAKHNEKQARYWVSERSVGEFHRSFAFPARVDQDAVKASLKNGILSILVPKSTAPQARRVNIALE